jgi:hypothetical protein
MPRRRKPAGLECLVELARKSEILELELSRQRDAIARLTTAVQEKTAARVTNTVARLTPRPTRSPAPART